MTSPLATSITDEREPALDLQGSTASASKAFTARVCLYLKVLFFINLMFSTMVAIMTLANVELPNGEREPSVLIFALTAFNGIAWFALSRSRHRVRAAMLTEAVGTLIVIAIYARLILFDSGPLEQGSLILTSFLSCIVLVLRSSLVPASAFTAAIVGTIVAAGIVTVGTQVIEAPPVFFVWNGMTGIIVVVVTTVTSHTIYGLHMKVSAVRSLGQYQLEHRVGSGGMGEVFLAKHSLLQRPTAIKLLHDTSDPSAQARFRKEVQTASGLSHPNTIEIYDYGRTPEGVFYFAMEYVEGATLNQTVAATGPMPAARVVHLLLQAAGSLSEAHGRGLVHRDIKPSNLMLCERGGMFDTLKVLDFGLVRDLGSASEGSEGLTGTPLYLAPEAIVKKDGFLPESDIYALGATAYFLLTGAPPFTGTLTDILSDHLATVPAEPISDDPILTALVMRCLEKDLASRPRGAAELIDEIKLCTTYGVWTTKDARIWWAEHRDLVDSVRLGDTERSSSSRASFRAQSRRTQARRTQARRTQASQGEASASAPPSPS